MLEPWAKLQAMLQGIPHFWVLVLGALFLVPGLLFLGVLLLGVLFLALVLGVLVPGVSRS